MYVTFDKNGVLHIRPDNYNDVHTLKWFLKEYAEHGIKMIEIETDLDRPEQGYAQRSYPQYEDAYGYSNKHREDRGYYRDRPPFSPRSEYNYPDENIVEMRPPEVEGDDPYRVDGNPRLSRRSRR